MAASSVSKGISFPDCFGMLQYVQRVSHCQVRTTTSRARSFEDASWNCRSHVLCSPMMVSQRAKRVASPIGEESGASARRRLSSHLNSILRGRSSTSRRALMVSGVSGSVLKNVDCAKLMPSMFPATINEESCFRCSSMRSMMEGVIRVGSVRLPILRDSRVGHRCSSHCTAASTACW